MSTVSSINPCSQLKEIHLTCETWSYVIVSPRSTAQCLWNLQMTLVRNAVPLPTYHQFNGHNKGTTDFIFCECIHICIFCLMGHLVFVALQPKIRHRQYVITVFIKKKQLYFIKASFWADTVAEQANPSLALLASHMGVDSSSSHCFWASFLLMVWERSRG